MSKNTTKAVLLLILMVGYLVYEEGLSDGLFLFFQFYTTVLAMLLACWLIYRLVMGTWSLDIILKNAAKLRTPEEELEYGSESSRSFGIKFLMISGAVVALVGLVVKIISDWK